MDDIKEKAIFGSEEKQIEEKTDALMSAIQETETYERYQLAMHKLQSNWELYSRFNEFRKKNMELEIERGDQYYNNAASLYNEYNELLMDRCVSEFLTAEQSMCIMVKKIYDRLSETVQMDISYLE